MKRVAMLSPASSGTVMVPEGQVAQFKARGWRLAESSKPKPAKAKSATKQRSADSDGDD